MKLPPSPLPSLRLRTACPSAGVVDLSFEAESPLAPPAELLERLPSYDCLFQGGGKSVGSWFLWPLLGASAVWGMSLDKVSAGIAPCHYWEKTEGHGT